MTAVTPVPVIAPPVDPNAAIVVTPTNQATLNNATVAPTTETAAETTPQAGTTARDVTPQSGTAAGNVTTPSNRTPLTMVDHEAIAAAQMAAADQDEESKMGTVAAMMFRKSTVTDPFATDINLETKAGREVFSYAIKNDQGFKKFNLDVTKAKEIWEELVSRKQKYSWKTMNVPTTGTGGLMPPRPDGTFFMGRDAVDLHDFKDLLSLKENKNITMEEVKAWASWYNGGDDQMLDTRPEGEPLTFDYVDPNVSGVQGSINSYKIQCRISAAMCMHTIKAMLTKEGWDQLMSNKHEFSFYSEVEQRTVYDGTIMVKMVTDVINPDVVISGTKYSDKLEAITLKSKGNNVRDLLSEINTLQQKIIETQGIAFCSDDKCLKETFRALGSPSNEVFRLECIQQQTYWIKKKPGVTKSTIFKELLQTFVNLEH